MYARKKGFRLISGLVRLSTVMEVTVDGMDAVVEPIGTYSRRVTGMTVLNPYLKVMKNLALHLKV